MPRTSYVYDPLLKRLVPKAGFQAPEPGPTVLRDIEPFVSPLDGTVVRSRAALRAHMRRHDVVPAAELSSDWAAAEQRRRAIREGQADRQARVAALSDAYEHVRNQRRARS